MNFLQPSFLWGLLFLIIPIIIHLFNFRKAKKIYFSNLEFLQQVNTKSSRKFKLKHLLVLLSRLFFLAFLVITFAQPFLPSENEGFKSNKVVVYLDNSHSMSALSKNSLPLLSEGIKYVESIIDLYPKSTLFHLLTNEQSFVESRPVKGKELKEKLTELNYSNVTQQMSAVTQHISSLDCESNNCDVYLISDFQKSIMNQKVHFKDSLTSINIFPLVASSHSNISIDSAYLNNPFFIPNQNNELMIRLRNSGEEDVDDISLRLFINKVQISNLNIKIDGNDIFDLTLTLPDDVQGENLCEVIIEDYPHTFDNKLYFVLSKIEQINVLEIRGKNIISNFIPPVFEINPLFSFASFNESNLDYNSIQNADLIILNELTTSIQSLIAQLDAENAPALIIIPSENNSHTKNNLSFSDKTIDRIEQPRWSDLEEIDWNNPFFKNMFDDQNDLVSMPKIKACLNLKNKGTPILVDKLGFPYLNQIDNNYLFASPLNENYTDLTSNALFVSIMQRIAELSVKKSNSFYHSITNNELSYYIKKSRDQIVYTLQQDDYQFIPLQQQNGNQLLIKPSKSQLNPGFYRLTNGNKTYRNIAFNIDKKESELIAYTQEQIREVFDEFSESKIFQHPSAKAFSSDAKGKYHNIELWKYSLVLSLIFLLIEILLIKIL